MGGSGGVMEDNPENPPPSPPPLRMVKETEVKVE